MFESVSGQIGSGAVVGFIVGMIMKKMLMLVALLVALVFASLGYLEANGYINVNWGFFDAGGATEAASSVAQTIIVFGTELIINFLLSIPAGAGFTGGAMLGFTRG